jgi:YHS domain-containing protein
MKQFFTAVLVLLSIATFCQTDHSLQRKKEFNLSKAGIGLSGYDIVSYFQQNKAVKGSSNFTVVYEGVTYYFSSQENKEIFQKNPSQYEPQYGGWCAYAMGSDGSKVEVDPETFKINNGKLYLFYHTFFNNTLNKWNADEARLKKNADANWIKIYKP